MQRWAVGGIRPTCGSEAAPAIIVSMTETMAVMARARDLDLFLRAGSAYFSSLRFALSVAAWIQREVAMKYMKMMTWTAKQRSPAVMPRSIWRSLVS